MRLLLIRHGEPDYEHDVLTEKGKVEAELLSHQLVREKIDDFYISPYGRAQETAAPTLKAYGKTGETLPWLHEFNATIDLGRYPELCRYYPDSRPAADGTFIRNIVWDMLPRAFLEDPTYLDAVKWRRTEVAEKSDLCEKYDKVCRGFDELVGRYGYRRNGLLYTTGQGTNRTLALFCHLGVTCVMLSYLFNISPFICWHNFCSLCSSVTELYTEEREKGIVTFRMTRFSDLSHLNSAGEKPSFFARFCSVYENEEERH